MKKSDLAGTGQVFAFTLTQYFKNKSTIITLLTMLVLSAVMMGIVSFAGGSAANQTDILPDTSADGSLTELSVAIINETELPLSTADVERHYHIYPLSIGVFNPDDPVEFDADTVRIRLYSTGGDYAMECFLPESCDAPSHALIDLDIALRGAIEAAHYRARGATEEQIAILRADVYINRMTTSEYADITSPDTTPDVLDPSNGALFGLSYAYSIIVLMLVMFSSSYIIRSVVEEKDSKLVELLMVSIKPLALILGKILATMVFVILILASMLLGAGLSAAVIGALREAPVAMGPAALLSSIGIDVSSTLRIALALPAVVISIILAYLTFSLISGVLGACCSKLEDTGTAMSTVTLLALGSYIMTTASSSAGSYGFAVFCSLCPFVSVFFAPVSYLTGIIDLGILALSWLLQAAVILLLALLCARVYGALIIHRGNRIKLKALIAIAHRGGGSTV